jgi:hypothetical protein
MPCSCPHIQPALACTPEEQSSLTRENSACRFARCSGVAVIGRLQAKGADLSECGEGVVSRPCLHREDLRVRLAVLRCDGHLVCDRPDADCVMAGGRRNRQAVDVPVWRSRDLEVVAVRVGHLAGRAGWGTRRVIGLVDAPALPGPPPPCPHWVMCALPVPSGISAIHPHSPNPNPTQPVWLLQVVRDGDLVLRTAVRVALSSRDRRRRAHGQPRTVADSGLAPWCVASAPSG